MSRNKFDKNKRNLNKYIVSNPLFTGLTSKQKQHNSDVSRNQSNIKIKRSTYKFNAFKKDRKFRNELLKNSQKQKDFIFNQRQKDRQLKLKREKRKRIYKNFKSSGRFIGSSLKSGAKFSSKATVKFWKATKREGKQYNVLGMG